MSDVLVLCPFMDTAGVPCNMSVGHEGHHRFGEVLFSGVWVHTYPDGSGVTPFATELDALRYANKDVGSVKFVAWGESV